MVEVNTLLFFCKLWFYAFSFGIASPNYLMTFIAISSSCPMQLFVIVNFCFSIWLKLLYICDAGSWLETWQEDFLMHMIYVHVKPDEKILIMVEPDDIACLKCGSWWLLIHVLMVTLVPITQRFVYIPCILFFLFPDLFTTSGLQCASDNASFFFVSWFIYHWRFAMCRWYSIYRRW